MAGRVSRVLARQRALVFVRILVEQFVTALGKLIIGARDGDAAVPGNAKRAVAVLAQQFNDALDGTLSGVFIPDDLAADVLIGLGREFI